VYQAVVVVHLYGVTIDFIGTGIFRAVILLAAATTTDSLTPGAYNCPGTLLLDINTFPRSFFFTP
jgi:hypothetical protein